MGFVLRVVLARQKAAPHFAIVFRLPAGRHDHLRFWETTEQQRLESLPERDEECAFIEIVYLLFCPVISETLPQRDGFISRVEGKPVPCRRRTARNGSRRSPRRARWPAYRQNY